MHVAIDVSTLKEMFQSFKFQYTEASYSIKIVHVKTRKLSYRKDDRAICAL